MSDKESHTNPRPQIFLSLLTQASSSKWLVHCTSILLFQCILLKPGLIAVFTKQLNYCSVCCLWHPVRKSCCLTKCVGIVRNHFYLLKYSGVIFFFFFPYQWSDLGTNTLPFSNDLGNLLVTNMIMLYFTFIWYSLFLPDFHPLCTMEIFGLISMVTYAHLVEIKLII